jgi:hypothetical protein
MVTGIGEKSRITNWRELEQKSGLVEPDTSGSGCRISNTGMEYKDGQMELNIMESGNRVIMMVTDIGSM